MKEAQPRNLEQFTRYLFEQFFSGNQTPWTDCLYKDCVFFSSFTPALIGADSIRNYFPTFFSASSIARQSYTSMKLTSQNYLVFGTLVLNTKKESLPVTVFTTLIYRYAKDSLKIVYHHLSYDSAFAAANDDTKSYQIPKEFFSAFTNCHMTAPLPLKSGNEIYYLPPHIIRYLQSNGHKTYVYCIDKTIECSMRITDIAEMLPENFYRIRRGCIINTAFVAAIRRSEIELLCGTIIHIPPANYAAVKKELNHLITEP